MLPDISNSQDIDVANQMKIKDHLKVTFATEC